MASNKKKPLILKGRVAFLKSSITQVLATRQLLRGDDIGRFYGWPITQYQSDVFFEPQIELYFVHQKQEDLGKNALEKDGHGRINFRLLGKTEANITLGECVALANKIKTKFMVPPFKWEKGKTMCVYSERKKKYKLQILCRSEAAGKAVIEQVLDIQGHSPDWENLTTTNNNQPFVKYPELPDKEIILGESVKLPRRRPNVDVYFRYALLHIHGLSEPLVLCDRSGKKRNPLVT